MLPVDVAEIIIKEPLEKRNDYQHFKSVLLKKFRLGAETVKTKFEDHKKKTGALWSEFVYEFRGYPLNTHLDNWFEIVKVNDYESLKELMLTAQEKRTSISKLKINS